MSIRSELNNTKHYLRESRKAILGRGGEISEKAGLKDIPEAVWSIPADASLAFREDSEVAYEKVVPVGAEEYALVKSLGGMSYKLGNNNLCSGDGVYTYDDESHTQTIYLGFYEAGEYFMSFDNSTLQNCGDHYLHNQDYSFAANAWEGGSLGGFNFTLDSSAELWLDLTPYAEMGNEGLLTGTLKNIMICNADDADKTYKPYQPPILVSAKPTSLESRGANLWSPFASQMLSGVTLTVYENGIYTLNGTATSSVNFAIRQAVDDYLTQAKKKQYDAMMKEAAKDKAFMSITSKCDEDFAFADGEVQGEW
jgi:hypothetical protein